MLGQVDKLPRALDLLVHHLATSCLSIKGLHDEVGIAKEEGGILQGALRGGS